MIVVGESVAAVLFEESERESLADRMAQAARILISAATLVETGIVARGRLGSSGLDDMWGIIRGLRIEVRDVDAKQSALAIDAYARFGRGGGHPAKLDFGDCFSYALAKSLDLPLLFKGDDFVHTDIRPAMVAG